MPTERPTRRDVEGQPASRDERPYRRVARQPCGQRWTGLALRAPPRSPSQRVRDSLRELEPRRPPRRDPATILAACCCGDAWLAEVLARDRQAWKIGMACYSGIWTTPRCSAKSSKSLVFRVASGGPDARQQATIQVSLTGRGRPPGERRPTVLGRRWTLRPSRIGSIYT